MPKKPILRWSDAEKIQLLEAVCCQGREQDLCEALPTRYEQFAQVAPVGGASALLFAAWAIQRYPQDVREWAKAQSPNLCCEVKMPPTLEDAIFLAAQAHQGQTDKGGVPYILHPLRVMLRMDTHEARMVAVLHDVVEDTAYTLDYLDRAGYPPSVLVALACLTHRKGEWYQLYVDNIKPNHLARKVKIADLEDNLDMSRIPNPTPEDRDRMAKYRVALHRLTSE